MLDIKFIIENQKLVEEGIAKKGLSVDIPALIALHLDINKLKTSSQALAEEKNRLSNSIKSASAEERPAIIAKSKALGEELKVELEKLAVDPHRDRAQMLKVENVQQAWQQWINKLPPARREDEDVKEIRWMIEELRVSYFAQQLGTPYPISDKRILQAMEQISG